MTNEEFLKNVCPNHTEKSKWNKSELLHILDMHKKQLSISVVSKSVVCENCDGWGYTVDENGRRKEHCKECE